jgi:poly-beta-hydroxyalkanoate depolymerase
MLGGHDVYITDWHNARDVPLADGPSGFDDFVGYLLVFSNCSVRGRTWWRSASQRSPRWPQSR